MRPGAADHGGDDADLGELLGLAVERVAVEHDQVGVEAGQEPAAPVLVAGEPGGREAGGVERLLDREPCSGCQAGRSSSVRRTPARMPASGSSSSIGASEPLATTAPESSSERYA